MLFCKYCINILYLSNKYKCTVFSNCIMEISMQISDLFTMLDHTLFICIYKVICVFNKLKCLHCFFFFQGRVEYLMKWKGYSSK